MALTTKWKRIPKTNILIDKDGNVMNGTNGNKIYPDGNGVITDNGKSIQVKEVAKELFQIDSKE